MTNVLECNSCHKMLLECKCTPTSKNWADICEEENEKQLEFLNKRFLSKSEIKDTAVLDLLNVPHDQSSFVRIFDESEDKCLQLIHYISSSNENVNHLRGVVVANENPPRVVCKSFPYTYEYLTRDFTLDDDLIAKSTIMEGFEGTILRVFHYGTQWYVSTHKKINGKSSRWSSPTFGELFNECLGLQNSEEPTFDFLNKDYCYVFLMSHPLNSLVCKNRNAILYHVVTYDTQNNMNIVEHHLNNKGILYPKVLDFKTSQQICDYVEQLSWQDYSCVVLFLPDGKMCKVLNSDYYSRRQIRGNEPNLRIRYLQLEKINKELSSGLVDLLPEKKEFFDKVQQDQNHLVQYLYGNFEYRYVNGNYLWLTQGEHLFLQDVAAHIEISFKNRYLQQQEKEKIKDTIRKRLQTASAQELNAMIKSMNS